MSTKNAMIFTIIICTFAFEFASSPKTDCIQIIDNVHVDPGPAISERTKRCQTVKVDI